jgi:hypothetical protein
MIGFGWLLQALCLRMFAVRIYTEFFGFCRDDGHFQKNKSEYFFQIFYACLGCE